MDIVESTRLFLFLFLSPLHRSLCRIHYLFIHSSCFSSFLFPFFTTERTTTTTMACLMLSACVIAPLSQRISLRRYQKKLVGSVCVCMHVPLCHDQYDMHSHTETAYCNILYIFKKIRLFCGLCHYILSENGGISFTLLCLNVKIICTKVS